jgi:hypothetical protein
VTRTLACVGWVLALIACKPTIIQDPEPEPRPVSDPADDPLIEQEAVRVTVRSYTAAIGEGDVETASAWVVAETFEFYEDLRIAALRSTREQLEALDLMRVLMILQVRATIPRAELEAVDGRGLFGFAVGAGLVGEGVDEVSLDEVWIAEDGVVAQIRLDGVPIVWLRKPADAWQMDIPETIRQLGPAIEARALEQVVADGKVLTAYTLLEMSSEKLVDFAVVDGPLEGAAPDTPRAAQGSPDQ